MYIDVENWLRETGLTKCLQLTIEDRMESQENIAKLYSVDPSKSNEAILIPIYLGNWTSMLHVTDNKC